MAVEMMYQVIRRKGQLVDRALRLFVATALALAAPLVVSLGMRFYAEAAPRPAMNASELTATPPVTITVK